MLVPVVGPLDDRVLVLSVVPAFVLHVVEFCSTAFGAGIGHPVPVISFDVLNLQGVVIGELEVVLFDVQFIVIVAFDCVFISGYSVMVSSLGGCYRTRS